MSETMTLQHIVDNRSALLAELHRRQAIVRDYVRGVARQYATGLYLFGRPGTAKTHTVRAVLEEEIRELYTYQRGHLTPMGLFELIAEHADEVIVLDDLGAVLKSDVALQILLSALEHPTSRDRSRVVKYRRQGREERAVFRGGIVCISNRELHDDELLGAFKSRVHTLNYDPTDAQLGALMLDIADRGWPAGSSNPEINPETARTVAHYLIGEMLRLACPFDLRLLVNKAFPDYQQWKDGEAESDWRDLVTASIEEHLVAVRHSEESPVSREARKEEERSIVRGDHPGSPVPGRAGPGLDCGRASRSGPFTGVWRRCGDNSRKCQTVNVTRTGITTNRSQQRIGEDQWLEEVSARSSRESWLARPSCGYLPSQVRSC